MKKFSTLIQRSLILLLVSLLSTGSIYAQRTGAVSGKMVDASNGEPLFFGNVSIKGTAIGTVTDEYGRFELERIPSGQQIIVLSYIGYNPKEVTVVVEPGETEDIGTHELTIQSVMGEEVTVTAQLRGQASAINQQVKSNTIVNVVSKEKIEEVPDANAAESISRLPGITLSRSGGEGSQVTVRGVSPRFNSITINGQQIPATGVNDRSVNLSMISSDLLDGIEVYKAITPDMDADAIGGNVNLVTKTADAGGIQGRVHLETGYSSLIENIGSYRGAFTLGNRFFDEKFGVIIGANYHRANRNADFFEGDYELTGDGGYRGNRTTLRNVTEWRDRYGASATLDYKFKNGEIVFDHVYSETSRDIVQQGMGARPTISVIEISMNKRENLISLNSSNLRGDFEIFGAMDLSFNLGRSKSTNETPYSFGAGAEKESGLTPEADAAAPLDMMRYARFDLQGPPPYPPFYGGHGAGRYYQLIEDLNYTGQLDLKLPFALGTWISGNIKFGGKFRYKERDRFTESHFIFDWEAYNIAFNQNFPQFNDNDGLYPSAQFIDPDYVVYDSPFEDHNDIPFVFDEDLITSINERMTQLDSLWRPNNNDKYNTYNATELITAGYLMAEIKLGTRVTLIPGFRYENTALDFTGFSGLQRNNDWRISGSDTSATNSIGEFLPMVHLKYEFVDGFSLRLAATKTLSRPNFTNLLPFEQIRIENRRSVVFGSIDLKLPTAWNYDAMLSWFSKFGYVAVGAFYKEIYDIDVRVSFIDYSDPETNPYYNYKVTSPINLDQTTTIYGGEIEVQTNLRFLPKPLDGFVLSGNLTVMDSESYYPFFYTAYPPPDYQAVTEDSFRIESTQGQADFVANFTVGYEKGGFSGRVSMNYQGPKFYRLGASPFQDEYEDEYIRWDAAASYKFNEHWQVLVNLINFTNEAEREYMYTPEQPNNIEYYGWQANLGVRYNF